MPKASSTPAAVPRALTVEQWRASKALQTRLAAALDDPILQMAFQTLLNAAMPRTQSVTNPMPGVSAEAMDKSLAYAFQAAGGFLRFHDRLHALTKLEGKKPVDITPWGGLQPEPAE